jgi:Ser/Thr protein kinase RdoA (MazF antagonist)
VTILEGWDSHAWIDGPWIHRSPRRPEVRPELLAELAEFRTQIVPLLPSDVQAAAHELLDRVAVVRTSVIHSDLGPDHILMTDGRITGITDWTDDVSTGLREILTSL